MTDTPSSEIIHLKNHRRFKPPPAPSKPRLFLGPGQGLAVSFHADMRGVYAWHPEHVPLSSDFRVVVAAGFDVGKTAKWLRRLADQIELDAEASA